MGAMNNIPDENGALIALHEATSGGAALGSRLTIPTGFAGVAVKDGKPLDMLAAGDHLLEPSLLPGLIQKVKPRFGIGQGPEGTAPLPAAVFLVPVSWPVSVPWRTQAILSKNPTYGLTYTALGGALHGPDWGPCPLLRRRLPGGQQSFVHRRGIPRSGRAGVPTQRHPDACAGSRPGDESSA